MRIRDLFFLIRPQTKQIIAAATSNRKRNANPIIMQSLRMRFIYSDLITSYHKCNYNQCDINVLA